MREYSRILIEDYCRDHKDTKSKKLSKLVEMSYDLYCEPTDADGIYLEKAIEDEQNPELRKHLLIWKIFCFPDEEKLWKKRNIQSANTSI